MEEHTDVAARAQAEALNVRKGGQLPALLLAQGDELIDANLRLVLRGDALPLKLEHGERALAPLGAKAPRDRLRGVPRRPRKELREARKVHKETEVAVSDPYNLH